MPNQARSSPTRRQTRAAARLAISRRRDRFRDENDRIQAYRAGDRPCSRPPLRCCARTPSTFLSASFCEAAIAAVTQLNALVQRPIEERGAGYRGESQCRGIARRAIAIASRESVARYLRA